MSDRLFQDEPGMEARRLSRWFASRLGVRHELRQMFTVRCCECGEVKVLVWQRRCSFCSKGEGKMK